MQARCAAALLLVATAAGQPPTSPVPKAPDCWEMCKHAEGLGADACMAECRTYTDSAEKNTDSLQDFVEDKTYNEAGHEDMEKAFEKKYDKEIPSCKPQFDSKPSFKDIDEDGDGIVTASEAMDFGAKMCVTDEMAMQMFSMADRNRDKVIDPKEWNQVGEDTAAEKAIDDVVDDTTASKSDDEYNEVKMPAFETFDSDKNGHLDDSELQSVLMFEFYRRFPEASKAEKHVMAGDITRDLGKIVAAMDSDGDGKISKAEFETRPKKGEDFGGELAEAAAGDKNGEDPDDLNRVEHPTISPVPEDYLPSGTPPVPKNLFFARMHMGGLLGRRARHRRAPSAHIRDLVRRAVRRQQAHGLRLRRRRV